MICCSRLVKCHKFRNLVARNYAVCSNQNQSTLCKKLCGDVERSFSKSLNRGKRFSEKQEEKDWVDICNVTSYYFEDGLRKVYPYFDTLKSYCKLRNYKKNIVDFYMSEFCRNGKENVRALINAGRIKVNQTVINENYVLQPHDFISSLVHRHEPPVLYKSIDILHCDDDVLVVNKPPSIPVHPAGMYKHNTMLYILGREYSMRNLYVVHRLDKDASGVLIFARSKEAARRLSVQMGRTKLKKEYVCRVVGNFPGGEIVCDAPLDYLCPKNSIMKVVPGGKKSKSLFKKIGFCPDTNTSIVSCIIETGRTHQIRIHLQYLGFPVWNDGLYNHPAFGPERGKGGNFACSDEMIIDRISSSRSWFKRVEKDCSARNNNLSVKSTFNPSKATFDVQCDVCNQNMTFEGVKPEDLELHLHSVSYSGEGWEYQSPLPDWAHFNWKDVRNY